MIFKNQDEKLKKRVTMSEKDVFWDVSDITPPKKSVHIGYHDTNTDTTLVVSSDADKRTKTESIPKREEYNSTLLSSYTPKDSLLTEVSVFSWHSEYTFYERFCLDAHKYFNAENDSTECVKYFSYMPSYMQMSTRQKRWYFYWRSKARQGEYLPTDSSYVMLFIYEIINLPDLIDANEGIALLCELWRNYRSSYTKLDKYMSEWVCDYCLINGLKLPYDTISSFIFDAIDLCALKQFYMPISDGDDAYSSLLFFKVNSYKWWKSKYITDDNRSIFEKHIRNGFSFATRLLAESDGRFDGNINNRLEQKKAARDSFSGALCAYHVKR
ncbi:MAG: TerB N-terminal domain-containing protein, partial [Clostridia bacterium]|nr:TerB N-terminal domain-containing protein [Clostridia bacterium]